MTQNPGDQAGDPGSAYSGPPSAPAFPGQPPALAYPEYPGYGAPPAGGYPGYPGYQPYASPYAAVPGYAAYSPYPPQPVRDTNIFAILALIGALTIPPLGIIAGHVALVQLKRTGDNGRGLAIAGLVIGYVITLFLAALIGLMVWLEAAYQNELDDYNREYGVYSMAVTSGQSTAPPSEPC